MNHKGTETQRKKKTSSSPHPPHPPYPPHLPNHQSPITHYPLPITHYPFTNPLYAASPPTTTSRILRLGPAQPTGKPLCPPLPQPPDSSQ